MEMEMEKWNTDEVLSFVQSLRGTLDDGDVDALTERVKSQHLTGKHIVRCMSVTHAQDILGLTIVKAGTVAKKLRLHLEPSAPPRKPEPRADIDSSPSPPPPTSSSQNEQQQRAFKVEEAEPAELDKADLRNVRYVHWSAGGLGSTGVFFVDTGSGWVVAKPTGTKTAGEIYAAFLAKRFGITCPNFRVPRFDEQEVILRAMRFGTGQPEHVQRLRNHRIQGLVFMDLIKGYPLPACGMKVLAESSVSNHFYTACNLLRQFGEILVLDMITNNFDRMPFVWNNFGNLENLMVQGNVLEDDGNLTAASIDQGATCIKDETGRANYMDRIRDGIKEACVERNAEGEHFKRLRQAFINGTGYDIDVDGCQLVMEGIRYGCAKLDDLLTKTPTLFHDVYEETSTILQPCGDLPHGLEEIEVQFFEDTAAVIRQTFQVSL
eukprot:m.125779 g.125779  ORF g.125779 m.125779 type:complete len:435 (-) comp15626_c8_seq2:208-1512(-)